MSGCIEYLQAMYVFLFGRERKCFFRKKQKSQRESLPVLIKNSQFLGQPLHGSRFGQDHTPALVFGFEISKDWNLYQIEQLPVDQAEKIEFILGYQLVGKM